MTTTTTPAAAPAAKALRIHHCDYSMAEVNSVCEILLRTGGTILEKDVTLNANNTTANLNLFQITGAIEILSLSGEFTDVTDVSNMTSSYFDYYNGASTVITKNDQVLSNAGLNSQIIVTEAPSVKVTFLNTTTGGMYQSADLKKMITNFMVYEKNGSNSYIRFNYTTNLTPINGTMTFTVMYRPLDGGTLTAV